MLLLLSHYKFNSVFCFAGFRIDQYKANSSPPHQPLGTSSKYQVQRKGLITTKRHCTREPFFSKPLEYQLQCQPPIPEDRNQASFGMLRNIYLTRWTNTKTISTQSTQRYFTKRKSMHNPDVFDFIENPMRSQH